MFHQYNDSLTTVTNYAALSSFYTKFPHLKQNDFYLAGESYAGIYVTLLAVQLLDQHFPVNLKGVLIGNGFLDPHSLRYQSLNEYLVYHGLLDSIESPYYPPTQLYPYHIYRNCIPPYWYNLTEELAAGKVPCENFHQLVSYFNRKVVQEAIHIDPAWNGNWSYIEYWILKSYKHRSKDLSVEMKHLLESGIKVLVYNGDCDLVCNFIGNKR